MGELFYNGKSLSDFGVLISGSGTYAAPKRKYTKQEIAGRNGDIVTDEGNFENVSIVYPASIPFGFNYKFDDLKAFLLSDFGYRRIEDTYHPNEFRLGFLSKEIEPEPTALNRGGSFELEFDCKPQRFLKSGEKATTANTIINPTLYPAKPLIVLNGENGALTINGEVCLTVASNTSNTGEFDSETLDFKNGDTNLNNYITISKIPTLTPGLNTITSTFNSFSIYPRWWTV